MLVVIFDLHFIFVSPSHFWSSICCCSSFVVFLYSSFSFQNIIITHPSRDYRRVFAPTLYFQPGPLHSDSKHFQFQPFRYLLTASVTPLSGHLVPTGIFNLHSFTDILPTLIKDSLGAGSSSLKFAGLYTGPRKTDPAHLFVWFIVIHNLHIQNDSSLNSTIYYHELLVVKV